MLSLPSRNSFVAGFATALIVVWAIYLWQNSGLIGGVRAASPNGACEQSVVAPIEPRKGGSYQIRLIDKRTLSVVRETSITVSPDEKTEPLRDVGSVVWDPGNTFADIQLRNVPIVRLWVP